MTQRTNSVSWIDKLIAWVELLPGPNWLFYLISLITLGIANNSILWIEGINPVGHFVFGESTDAIWAVGFLAFFHHNKAIAKEVLLEILPLIDTADENYSSLENRLLNLPAKLGWLAIGMGTILLTPVSLTYANTTFSLLSSKVYTVLTGTLFAAGFFAFIFQTMRQLRIISSLQTSISGIDLLNLRPALAFSKFTSKTGMLLIFFVVFAVIQAIVLGSSVEDATEYSAWLALNLSMLAGSLAIFVLPLASLRYKLLEEKKRYLEELNKLIKSIYAQIRERLSHNKLEETSELKTALEILLVEREDIRSVSTLPWETSTFRSFASTFLFPIILWAATRILERFL